MSSRSLSRRSRAAAIAGVAAVLAGVTTIPASASAPARAQDVAVASAADVTPVRDFVGVGGDALNGGVWVRPEAQIRLMGDSNYLAVRVHNDDVEPAHVRVSSAYGERSLLVEPGRSGYVAVNLRTSTVPLVPLLIVAEVLDAEGSVVRGTGINMMNVVLPEG
ncbi:hypothetical protein ACFQ8E_05105 [Isoptericola sp. NPDC056573]|uniref:hypothetical protein n=1 Tax=Isoptericola sp. NPDC056573 TaxID=3345868 RepID=UPI0036CE93D3